MQLTSPLFNHQSSMPSDYTCKGRGVNPPLSIHNVPPDAKSLAVIFHDPDSVSHDFTHWTIWNISPTQLEIPENATPASATEGITDYGKTDYGPPCPPPGTGVHRYTFDLYALDVLLDLPSGASRSDLEAAIAGHIIDKAQLIGLFSA
ncbi:MAG TPA: YbhB/YbcL family Raf kinase inhibitor-like protein [Candidatus Saccharimonadales bacterium]